MPIKTQNDLPAKEILENENIFVMDEFRAVHQGMRPLQVLILNNMPVKQDTELQLLRALSNTPLQVDVTFMNTKTHVSLNTPASHLNKFYTTFDEIKDRTFDGLIVTGAPVEDITFEEVFGGMRTRKDSRELVIRINRHVLMDMQRYSCLNIILYVLKRKKRMFWLWQNVYMLGR